MCKHSWVLDNKTLYESTVRREVYFGVALPKLLAFKFFIEAVVPFVELLPRPWREPPGLCARAHSGVRKWRSLLCQQRFSMRPHSRGGPVQGARWIAGQGWCGRLKGVVASVSRQKAPRSQAPTWLRDLTVGELSLPWARRHFIISLPNGKRRGGLVERVGACSRGASAGSRRRIRRAGIAVLRVVKRRGVGVGHRPAGVTEPAQQDASGGGCSSNAIGNGSVSEQPQRQLTGRRRARASAQPVPARILSSACALGPAVTSRFGRSPSDQAGVFAAWRAAWRYGACWIGKPAIGSGAGAGGVNE